MENKIVQSQVYPLEELFNSKFDVDFYQREYVWERKQMEDLLMDLSTEFLKNYHTGDPYISVDGYDPYYMGEIVLSLKSGQRSAIIDGQQRITSLTLLLIYLIRNYGSMEAFPDVSKLIYSDYYGTKMFNLDIEERRACMLALYNNGEYLIKEDDTVSVHNIIERYNDISDCWNEKIDNTNIIHFVYWLKAKVMFSKVWTNSDEFAYVIFETMNDRGLSLTQVEMLRSYLLANVIPNQRDKARQKYDKVVERLTAIKLGTRSKAEFEFFKIYFRGHYAEDLSQATGANSDFIRIGKEFHRWVRDNSESLNLNRSEDFVGFIDQIDYFSKIYARINQLILNRKSDKYLYLIVNSDYKFTLQPALILAAVKYGDSDTIVEEKIQIVSKYITKLLSWRVWNHWQISQNTLENQIYELCKKIRNRSPEDLKDILLKEPMKPAILAGAPVLNQQNKQKLKVLIALITAIVARESGEDSYILNQKDIEVEHIWANHYDQHKDEFESEDAFAATRNVIGDLLCLPKSFNASYNDDPYTSKVKQYFSQNILAQSLNHQKYVNNPGFVKFIKESGIPFRAYEAFTKDAIAERTDLYRAILRWNWDCMDEETVANNSELNSNTSIKGNELKKRYWAYALPMIKEVHSQRGSFSNVSPSASSWISGYFGIGGFSVNCVANNDETRVDFWLGSSDIAKNKKGFDLLLAHKDEIEQKLGTTELEWARATEYKASWITYGLKGIGVKNEDNWPTMAQFHTEWSKKIADVMIPYLSELSSGIEISPEKAETNKALLHLSVLIKEWAVNRSQLEEMSVNIAKCNKTYTRFRTAFMDEMFADTPHTKSGWNTENHYFYEILNKTGNSVFMQLAFSSKEMPSDQIEITDRINVYYPSKGDKPGWEYRVPFKTKPYIIENINDKDVVFKQLDKCFMEIKGFEDELKKIILT